MKLRIKGNSLRLRLSKTEVARLGSTGKVQEIVSFGAQPQEKLCYRLETTERDFVLAELRGTTVTVFVPQRLAEDWVGNEEVGLEAIQKLEDGTELRISIEKDFACLNPRNNEDESDSFPHPKDSKAC